MKVARVMSRITAKTLMNMATPYLNWLVFVSAESVGGASLGLKVVPLIIFSDLSLSLSVSWSLSMCEVEA